ncbi:MAG: hypothetical protein OXB94_06540 [Nitrospira sp.]|nr:hypothetical protein [Nitrospira sp.]
MTKENAERLIQRLIDNLPYRYKAKLVNGLLQLSTHKARSRLAGSGPIMVLIDNSVLGHGRTHETVVHMQKINWPPGGEPGEVPIIYRAPIDFTQKDRELVYRNIRYLPGIAHLARLGFLMLRTSCELLSERNHQPIGRFQGKKGLFDYSLLENTNIESVDGYDVPDCDLKYFSNNPTVDKFIYSTDIDPLGMYPENKQKQRDRVSRSNDPLYKGLARILPKKANLDAWHIRTAEVHGLFCFLTMDFKLRNIIEQKKKKEPISSLRTMVLTPKEFGQHIGLWPIEPQICELAESDAAQSSARLRESLQ